MYPKEKRGIVGDGRGGGDAYCTGEEISLDLG